MKTSNIKIGKYYAVGKHAGSRDRVRIDSHGGVPGTWRVEYDSKATEVIYSRAIRDFWDEEVIAKTRNEVAAAAAMARAIAADSAQKTGLEEMLPAFRGIMVSLGDVGVSSTRPEDIDLADALQNTFGKCSSQTITLTQAALEKIGARIKQLSLEKQGAFWS
jgi:hypothetical protein